MDKAKDCPHCGTKANVETASDNGVKYARCRDANCKAFHFVPLGVWNNRPIEDALREERDASRAQVTKLTEKLANAEVEKAELRDEALIESDVP